MSPSATTLVELWEESYRKINPDDVFLQIENRTYTYRRVNAYAHCLAAYMLYQGIKPGQSIVLVGDYEPLYVCFELAVQFVGGVNLTVSENASYLQTLVTNVQPALLFLSSYSLYHQNRSWIDPLSLRTKIVCHTLADEPREYDKITTLESAISVGKNYWRENFLRLNSHKKRVTSNDNAAMFIINEEGTINSLQALTHTHLLNIISYQLKELVLKDAKILNNMIGQYSLIGRTAGFYTPLYAGYRLLYTPTYNLYLTFMQHYQPNLLLINPNSFAKVMQKVHQDFQHRHSIRARYYHPALNIAAKVLKAGNKVSFFLKIKYYYANQWILKPVRKAYFTQPQLILLPEQMPDLELLFNCLKLNFFNRLLPEPIHTYPTITVSSLKKSSLNPVKG